MEYKEKEQQSNQQSQAPYPPQYGASAPTFPTPPPQYSVCDPSFSQQPQTPFLQHQQQVLIQQQPQLQHVVLMQIPRKYCFLSI